MGLWSSHFMVERLIMSQVVLMREKTDCEVAMIATECEVTYEKACKVVGWKDLPYGIENPLYGNPYNAYLALLRLGFWKQNVEWKRFQKGESVCVLIHYPEEPTLKQHWIVRRKMDEDKNHYCYFGSSKDFAIIDNVKMKELIFKGYPNCIFKVIKVELSTVIFEWLKIKWQRLWGIK